MWLRCALLLALAATAADGQATSAACKKAINKLNTIATNIIPQLNTSCVIPNAVYYILKDIPLKQAIDTEYDCFFVKGGGPTCLVTQMMGCIPTLLYVKLMVPATNMLTCMSSSTYDVNDQNAAAAEAKKTLSAPMIGIYNAPYNKLRKQAVKMQKAKKAINAIINKMCTLVTNMATVNIAQKTITTLGKNVKDPVCWSCVGKYFPPYMPNYNKYKWPTGK